MLQGVADKKGSIKALSLGAKIKRKGATLGRNGKKYCMLMCNNFGTAAHSGENSRMFGEKSCVFGEK